jgi:hypothetical protein
VIKTAAAANGSSGHEAIDVSVQDMRLRGAELNPIFRFYLETQIGGDFRCNFPAGALAIGGFGRSRWRLRRTRRNLSLLYGFSISMAFQWPFRHLIASGVPEPDGCGRGAVDKAYCRSNRESRSKQKSPPRARDSVRRASDFVQIPIAVNDQRSKRDI